MLEKHVAIKEYFPAADVPRGGGMTVTVTNTQRTNQYQTGLDRFLQEARTLAGFAHPNIVRVNRYFKANGTGYMGSGQIEMLKGFTQVPPNRLATKTSLTRGQLRPPPAGS
ncbi:MAG: hypothetical protein ACK5UX_00360 [Burkholderiales bacterium]